MRILILATKKTKVVYNASNGVFQLSAEGEQLLINKKRWNKYIRCNETDESIPYNNSIDYKLASIPRHDCDLVAVVEELGEKASAQNAKLVIQEINEQRYKIIKNVFGKETVALSERAL